MTEPASTDRFPSDPYRALHDAGRPQLADLAWKKLQSNNHGDLPRWLEAIAALPLSAITVSKAVADHDAPRLGESVSDEEQVRACLDALHPWRKGPLQLAGVPIDTEWRSDLKWNRIAPFLNLEGKQVLDIGSGNGYFGLRMLAAGAKLVVGVDPTLVFVMQWLAMQKLSPELENYVLPLGIEDLPSDMEAFDTVFSMGVLYHRRDPIKHLEQLKALTRPGGQILMETLVLESENELTLIPEGRYARMRNVHAIPSVSVLQNWLEQAGLQKHQLLDISKTTLQEQRTTDWMRFESLRESLDPDDLSLTIEGHPAPTRAAILVDV
jgi:tRNA (mo5U34)-methyltransferase